jgi:homoserine kinase
LTAPRPRTNGGAIRLRIPYSVANVGPGFDRFGLCLDRLGDRIEFRPHRSGGLRLAIAGDPSLSTDPGENVASAALIEAYRALGSTPSGELRIVKGCPGGTGLGSSGASAVGGALAAALAVRNGLATDAVIDSVLQAAAVGGERLASGAVHYDNVAASLFGGFTFVESVRPLRVQRITPPADLRVVVALPATPLTTRESRSVLPDRVPLRDASENIGRACALVHGLLSGDSEEISQGLSDRLAEPYRAGLVPGFEPAREAAIRAGAWGAGLAGSGPSIFALTSRHRARGVLRSMHRALRAEAIRPRLFIAEIGRGASVIEFPEPCPTATAGLM